MSAPSAPETAALREQLEASRQAPGQPYRGLEPFGFADTGILAAREAEIERLVRLVTMYRGVLLYGESGSGKSSLVSAGLLPRLVEDGYWPHRVRVQPRPNAEIVLEPIRTGGGFLPSAFPGAPDGARLVLSAEGLGAAVEAACERARLVLVFDQFEELVTLFGESGMLAEAQPRVVHAIVQLLRDRQLRVKLLFAFREDYLASLEPLLAEQPELADQSLRLVPPPADSAARIIRAPFERYAGAYERELSPELAERISASLALRNGTGGLNLSELQVVCRRLWREPDPGALLEKRGVEGLLEDFLDERLRAFEAPCDDIAVALLTRLVTTSGTRNVVSGDDLIANTAGDRALVEQTLQRLENDARLVRSERRRDVTTYEIVSEFLVPRIAARKRQRDAAAAAERARAAVAADHQRELDRRRRLLLRYGSLVALLVIVGFARLAIYALDQRDHAVQDRDGALANERAASAGIVVRSDPALADTLALKSLEKRWTPAAENILRTAISLPMPALTLGGSNASTGASCCVGFSRDGRHVVGTEGSTVHVWDALSGRSVLAVPHGAFTNVAAPISPDGRTVLVNSPQHEVRQYDLRTGAVVRRLKGHVKRVYSAVFSPDGRLIAAPGADGFVYIWYARDGTVLGDINTHDRSFPLNAARFSADSRNLVTLRHDGLVEVWHMPTGRVQWLARNVAQIALPSRGPLAALVFRDGRVQLRVASTGRIVRRFADPRFAASLAAFDPSGNVLVALRRSSRALRVWSVPGGRRVGTLSTDANVNDFALSANGDLLATAEPNGATLWDVRTRASLVHLNIARPPRAHAAAGETPAKRGRVSSVAFSAGATRLATAGTDGRVRLWDMGRIRPRALIHGHSKPVWSTAFSRAGDRIATAGEDGFVTVSTVPAGRRLLRLPVAGSTVEMASFSPDGVTIGTADGVGHIRLWDAQHGKLLHTLRAGSGDATSVDFSADGRAVAGAADQVVRVWSVDGGAPLRTYRAPSPVEDAVFSPDSRRLAAATDDGDVRIFDRASGRVVHTLQVGHGGVFVVAYSVDGQYVAAGTAAGVIEVWDAARGIREATLTGHTSFTASLAFTPDGRHLLSASADGTVRFWDWRALVGAVVASNIEGGASVALTPHGYWLSAAGQRNTALLLPCAGCLPLEALKTAARDRVRPLTPAEQRSYLHAGEVQDVKPF